MVSLALVKQIEDSDLKAARHYLADLSEAIAAERVYAAAIIRLKVELENAIADYEIAQQEEAPFEDCLAKQADLLWLCNQCKYYLSVPHTATDSRLDRGLWQVRRAVAAIALLKLVACARNLLPGTKAVSLPWRDVFSGIRLGLGKREIDKKKGLL